MCYSWGPHAAAQKKNGSGRPCSAPGKMRVDKVDGYAVGRKNCDIERAGSLIGAAWPHPVEGVVGRFLWRLRLCHPSRNSQCSQQVALTKVSKKARRQPIQIFQRKVFKKQTLQVGLGETSMLPHKAEVEGRRRLQLQFPDAKLCRQQANGTTGRCFESWASEKHKKKMQLNPCSWSGTRFTPPLGAGLQPRLWPRSWAGETASAPSQTGGAQR